MLYLQLKERVTIPPGAKITVEDLADVLGDEAEKARKTQLDIHVTSGVWKVPSAALVKSLLPLGQPMTLMGPDMVAVHVSPGKGNGGGKVRSVLAFLLLMLGSALAITWFHADVGMQDAQSMFYRMISGREATSPWLLTVPYAVGVGLGVGMYYSLLSRRKTISPLDIKLEEYCEKAEKTAGRVP